jgi:hypothetical protein
MTPELIKFDWLVLYGLSQFKPDRDLFATKNRSNAKSFLKGVNVSRETLRIYSVTL